MINTVSAVTGTVIMCILFVMSVALAIKIAKTIKESIKQLAKVKRVRFLEFKDYINVILLSIMFCLSITGTVITIYAICKFWGIF